LRSEQDDDNPGREQHGKPDKRVAGPQASSHPLRIRGRSLRRRGPRQSGIVIGRQRLFRHYPGRFLEISSGIN